MNTTAINTTSESQSVCRMASGDSMRSCHFSQSCPETSPCAVREESSGSSSRRLEEGGAMGRRKKVIAGRGFAIPQRAQKLFRSHRSLFLQLFFFPPALHRIPVMCCKKTNSAGAREESASERERGREKKRKGCCSYLRGWLKSSLSFVECGMRILMGWDWWVEIEVLVMSGEFKI
ncbi:hypothetical protein CEXT_507301 [Caerostris extrusa]|uniref:Uncharacterized protein n=1 Tax=Caerostris extrusa TaxID=172846 RepID=A0AAV4M717_CAEEX|nr:hypothetical protein CEXT_507301 [Caerostris extrusa]